MPGLSRFLSQIAKIVILLKGGRKKPDKQGLYTLSQKRREDKPCRVTGEKDAEMNMDD